MPHRRRLHSAFTLVELLVVLVLLSLLASLVAPRVVGYVGSSQRKTAQIQVADITAALDLYLLDLGRYPNTEQGLKALVIPPSGAPRWRGPYLSKPLVPLDPWGRPYQYRSPGEHGPFDLYSFGADGKRGGEEEDGDVTSWE